MASVEARLGGVEISNIGIRQDLNEFKDRMSAFDQKMDALLVSLDKTIGALDALRLEYAAVSTQLSRHEDWIKKLAEKAGVALQY